jgi:hypothetical protein
MKLFIRRALTLVLVVVDMVCTEGLACPIRTRPKQAQHPPDSCGRYGLWRPAMF